MKNESRDIQLEKKIDSYIKGKLSEEEVDQLWVELLKKPEYIPLLQTEVDLARWYRAKKSTAPAVKKYWKWIAAAAAVVVLVISFSFFGNNSPKPLQQWTQNQIGLQDNLLSAPVTRSESHVPPADSMLNVGYKTAVAGNTVKAEQIYRDFLDQYDNPQLLSKAHLDLGILHYNSDMFDQSIEDFRTAIALADEQPLLRERAYWFMGNAYIKTLQLENARAAVQQTYTMGKLYKNESYRLLKRLDYELGNINLDQFRQQIDSPDN